MPERLFYEVLLESRGILRSRELHVELEADLTKGMRFALDGRDWRVAAVEAARAGADRRVIAHPADGG